MHKNEDLESIETTDVLLGTLENGNTVRYSEGGVERESSSRNKAYNTYNRTPYRYRILDEDGDESEVIEIPPEGSYNTAETPMDEMLSELGPWSHLTARALIMAYGTHTHVSDYPETDENGNPFIGIATALSGISSEHGSRVGLYLVDDKVFTPRVYDGESLRELPDGKIKDSVTFELKSTEDIPSAIRRLESDGVWYGNGGPHEVSESRIVTGYTVQVHHEYSHALRYSVYQLTDHGKRRL